MSWLVPRHKGGTMILARLTRSVISPVKHGWKTNYMELPMAKNIYQLEASMGKSSMNYEL